MKIKFLSTPMLLWGMPGVGKTAMVHAQARKKGLHLEALVASVYEPADFLGYPILRTRSDGIQETWNAPPAWARRLAEAGRGVLFIDEINTAPPAVQAALLRVVLERRVGDIQLPLETVIIAAANPPEIAAGGWELSPPLANRFVHIQYHLDPVQWVKDFPLYWGNPPALPDLVEQDWARARSLVAGFLHRRPELLLQVPKEEVKAGREWPSPRTWDYASRILSLSLNHPEEATDYLSGCVGEGAALEFITWLNEANLPSPEELLNGAAVPERADQQYAVLMALATYVRHHLEQKTWNQAWKVLAQAQVDVAAVAARELAQLRQAGWPSPKEVRAFLPLLKSAGLM